jgi:oligoendopeptidase F
MTKIGKLPNWNLDDLYKSPKDKNLSADLELSAKEITAFEKKYQNKISDLSGAELAKAIAQYEIFYQRLGKISAYSYLYFVTDMLNEERSSFYQNISEQLNDISIKTIFFGLEISKLSEKNLAEKLKDKNLKKYQPFIRDVRLGREYQKSQEIEEILHEKSQTSRNAWSRLFDETMAGLTFPYQKKELAAAEIFNLLASHDPKARKEAAKSVGDVLGKNIKLFSFITNTLAKDKAISDKIRNYPHPAKSRHVSNLIEDEVVDCLADTVKKNYKNLAHRYYQYKAELFGKKELDYWDRNAPLPDEDKQLVSWQDAKKTVLTAYDKFCPKMAEIAEMFFDKNWIDAAPKQGKDSGAFAHPVTCDTHPYVMLNYQGKMRDVATLAHELGHGIHQVLAADQGYLMAGTPLTLAETASVFGEQLTFESLLESCNDKKQSNNLIAGKIEDMLNTIVRQIAFYEFELAVHNQRKEKELTVSEINNIWLDKQKESLGPAIKFHDEYKYFWSYIPHFIHSPFYVYAYAFGNCLVNSLYSCYVKQPEGFSDKYKTMLSAGGTLHHSDLLKPFGLSAKDKQFWQGGLTLLNQYVDRLIV